tara:strand:+ start:5185 stop:5439 length:255 start_codon:yes stop_codon:yes gene_type:complete
VSVFFSSPCFFIFIFFNCSGARTEEGIVEYMIKKSGPSFQEVSSFDDVKTILDSQDYGVVVGYFQDREVMLGKLLVRNFDYCIL